MKAFLKILILIGLTLDTVLADELDVDETLRKADSLRSSNPQEFSQLLTAVSNQVSNFTPKQRDFYLYLVAYGKSLSGNFDEALDTYINLVNKTSYIDVKFRALTSVVNTYGLRRDFFNTSLFLNELISLRNAIDDQGLIENSYVIATMFFNETGQYQKAKDSSLKLLSYDLTPRKQCFGNHNLIEALYGLDPKSLEASLVQETIAQCDAIGERIISGLVTVTEGKRLISVGQNDKSLALLNNSESAIVQTKYPRLISDFYSVQAKVLFLLEQYDQAKAKAQRALEVAKNTGTSTPVIEA